MKQFDPRTSETSRAGLTPKRAGVDSPNVGHGGPLPGKTMLWGIEVGAVLERNMMW